MFCRQVHVIAMFNLSRNVMAMMTTTTSDVALQNMFLLTNYIIPHKTCWKLGARFLIKDSHGTQTLEDFYAYVELNKDIIVDVVGIYFC